MQKHFPYINNTMFAEQVDLTELAETMKTPFYCYSTQAIEENYLKYKHAFKRQDSLICYAVKANSNQAILTTLASLGCGADVVSEGEIRRAIAAGIPASKIVYSGVAKSREEVAYALGLDIFQFNVESEPELELISQVATSLGKVASISFRINPDVSANTHEKISTGKAENKFGVPISKARLAYKTAASLPGIKVQGVDVHIGSQLTELGPFKLAFEKISGLVEELRTDGHDIHVIDIGGGLGITYENEKIPPVKDYAAIADRALSHLKCKIVIEPGRSLLGDAGVLVSSVVYIKQGEERDFLIIDAGMNDLIRPSMYDAYHEVLAITPPENKQEQTYDIVGPVCETGDTFAKGRRLSSLKSGNLVAIMSCGAYGAVMSSTYNTRMLIPEVMVKEEKFAVIRERLTYEEVIAKDVVPDWLT